MNRRNTGLQANQRARRSPEAIPAMLHRALWHHRAGALLEAEELYRQILAIDRRHTDSLHLLGLIANATNRSPIAADLINRAVAINGHVAMYHFSLGGVLRTQQRAAEAAACYRRALALDPHFADAYDNLANILLDQGQLAEAIVCYQRALDLRPDQPETFNNLGIALKRSGQAREAMTCFRRALALKPAFAAARNNLGNALELLGQTEPAIDCYRRALDLEPAYADAHNNLGNALAGQGHLEHAITCFHTALDLRPDHPQACNNLGNALKQLRRPDDAAAWFRRAIALKPDYDDALYNHGNVLREQGHLDAAVANFHQAVQIRPDFVDAHINLGNTLAEQRRLDGAVACYRQALAITPDLPDAQFNLGLVLLARGELTAGWQAYESRWQIARMAKLRRDVPQPQWRGEAAVGRTLLIHAEQGFGDTLQFCRYATLAAARGLNVILEVPAPLVRLLRGLTCATRVMTPGDPLPRFDFHCPMLSLPLALETTLATIPSDVPYLHADAQQVAAWQTRLAALPRQGLRVGVVWAGDSRRHSPDLAAVDRRRSLDPAYLAPLFEVSGLHVFSLQKDGPRAPDTFPLTDVMAGMNDFADTAALIANLDLVIAVDTAVAHLAAALGKPVWLLDRFDSCWRWLTGRRDSPWYPTLRIYRQPDAGDWTSVLAEVVTDLGALIRA
jgi:tetratricopeptide (TPR) repeat protein